MGQRLKRFTNRGLFVARQAKFQSLRCFIGAASLYRSPPMRPGS